MSKAYVSGGDALLSMFKPRYDNEAKVWVAEFDGVLSQAPTFVESILAVVSAWSLRREVVRQQAVLEAAREMRDAAKKTLTVCVYEQGFPHTCGNRESEHQLHEAIARFDAAMKEAGR